MRRLSIIISILFIFPLAVQGAVLNCSDTGYTIIFINGVFDTEAQADWDRHSLQHSLDDHFNGEPLVVKLSYNQTHLAGVGDLAETKFPALDQYDLDTILRQMQDEVQTRKLLIVGHSQGAMYANKIYEYLTTHGVPKDSVGVYAVATPDSYVAGNGKYRNYALDEIIYGVSDSLGFHPLPPNLNSLDYINSNGESTDPKFHSFANSYLPLFHDKIVADIQTELSGLSAMGGSFQGACFEAPAEGTLSALEKGLYTTGDPLAFVVETGYNSANAALAIAGNLASSAYGAMIGLLPHAPAQTNETADGTGVQKAGIALLHALNLTSLTPKVVNELHSTSTSDLGSAAILALNHKSASTSTSVGIGTSTIASTGEVLGAETVNDPQLSIPVPQLFETPILGGGGGGGGGSSGGAASTDSQTEVTSDTQSSSEDFATSTTQTLTQDDVATSSEASSTPFVLAAPQNVIFSNWNSPAVTDNYCDVMERTADLSWSPVDGATGYEVWLADGVSDGPVAFSQTASASNIDFQFGLNWNRQVTVKVVAHDDSGHYATTSLNAQGQIPDKDSPIVETLVPSIGAANVPVSTALQIVYSKELDPSTVTNSNIGLEHYFYPVPASGPLGELVDSAVSLAADGKTVNIVPQSMLLAGQNYSTFASCKVKDLYGNHAGPLTFWSFSPQFMTTNDSIDISSASSTDASATSAVQ